MFLVFGLQVLWSLRLNGNTWRRGFFSLCVRTCCDPIKPLKARNRTEEDYRWPILRKRLPKWLYKITAFTFIAFIQNILLLAVALPSYLLLTARASEHPTRAPPALGWPDAILAVLCRSLPYSVAASSHGGFPQTSTS